MLKSVDRRKVQSVFKVFRARAASRPQYVVLMKDRGFVCTCLTLQNVGIVCRHFFYLMQQIPDCKYHISLIPRRWFHSKHQGLMDSDLKVQPFLSSEFQKDTASDERLLPPSDYMGSVRSLLPSMPQLPALPQKEASRTWRYSEISGKAKSIADLASNNTDAFHMVERELQILQRKIRAQLTGSMPVEDPEDVSPKGRFRTKRIKSSGERSRKRTKTDECREQNTKR
jgi:hypothetical protein